MSSILCIGNFGSGTDGQKKVANLIEHLYKKHKFKFIIGLGNNILPDGVKSKNDPKFITHFEEPYKNILNSIKFYNILGDADYTTRKSLNNEINYSKINKNWILPHNFYCFKKVINKIPVEFICLDSNMDKIKNNKIQEQWVLNTLYESKSRWNIVISHHPWYNCADKSETNEKLDDLFTKINNTKKVSLIISGHEYNQQHIFIPKKPNMIISGVGSETNKNPIVKIYKELKFSSNELGCFTIDFFKSRLDINYYNIKKKKIYNFSLHKL